MRPLVFQCRKASGFSLVEVLFATAILAVALVSLAQLFVVSTTNNVRARIGTHASIQAEQKMEQLRALVWSFDALGLAVTDGSTNTASDIESPTGGTGLTPSPENALVESVDGYVDYLDRVGNNLGGGGGGASAPPGTAFVRRWSIRPLEGSPLDSIALRVAVTPLGHQVVAASLASVKTRKAP